MWGRALRGGHTGAASHRVVLSPGLLSLPPTPQTTKFHESKIKYLEEELEAKTKVRAAYLAHLASAHHLLQCSPSARSHLAVRRGPGAQGDEHAVHHHAALRCCWRSAGRTAARRCPCGSSWPSLSTGSRPARRASSSSRSAWRTSRSSCSRRAGEQQGRAQRWEALTGATGGGRHMPRRGCSDAPWVPRGAVCCSEAAAAEAKRTEAEAHYGRQEGRYQALVEEATQAREAAERDAASLTARLQALQQAMQARACSRVWWQASWRDRSSLASRQAHVPHTRAQPRAGA